LLTVDDLLHDTPRRAAVLAELEPYRSAGMPWRHVGGYLGRSVVLRSGEVVLKCFFRAAESKWQRERRAYAFLAGSGLPVPRLIGSGRLRGEVPWLIVTAMPGVIATAVIDELPAAAFAESGRVLARLHGLVVDARSIAAPRPITEVSAPASTHRRATLELARSWVAAGMRTSVPVMACTHGDFSPRNLMFERRAAGWVLSGLIDFECCAYADPAIDFARMRIAFPRWDDPAFDAFVNAYAASAPPPRWDRVRLHIAAIVLDAATWAEARDLPYYDSLLDLVEKIERDSLQ
jgi:aminoglycoside phosphotransferase (APT) family kinase protein